MSVTCEYCGGLNVENAINCRNCGAPLPSHQSDVVNHSNICPSCGHKLLALASPRCNTCGKPLPEEFIRAREADLKRINELNTPVNTGSLLGGEISQAGSAANAKKLLLEVSELLS